MSDADDADKDLVMLWGKVHEYEQDILYLRRLSHELARRVAALEGEVAALKERAG
jgi:hypothetical protein